jgi:hypothetical protein
MYNSHDSAYSSDEQILLEKLRRQRNFDGSLLMLAIYILDMDSNTRVQILESLEQLLFLQSVAPYAIRAVAPELDVLAIKLLKGILQVTDVLRVTSEFKVKALNEINFAQVFSDWSKRLGAYGWQGLKYFMFEYEQELLSKTKTVREKLNWEEFARENFEEDYATVEHIYPQKAEAPCWKKAFSPFSVRQRNALKHSIGNLVPLSKPKNSSLRNKCFAEKKGGIDNAVGFAFGCYSEIAVSQCEDWTAREILERGLCLLEFMEARWKIPLGDRAKKIQLLGLDFVEQKLANAANVQL